jgi:hypothetical protein
MMKALLFLFLVFQYTVPQHTGALAVAPTGPTWTYVDTAVNASCPAGTTCTITGLTSTQTNSVLIAGYEIDSGFSANIVSATGGGGTWIVCASLNCYKTLGGTGTVDQAYNLTGTGGATSVTITTSSSIGVGWIAAAAEFHCTANCGTIALDQIGINTSSASCASCTGASFTGLTGTSDICEQFTYTPSGLSGGGTYTLDSSTGLPYLLNAASGTAPTFTQSSAGGFVSSGICFQ